MSDSSRKNASDLRRQHNSDLIRRMRNGESLNAIDSKSSWFPPRPVIKKDEREMARLYKDTAEKSAAEKAARSTTNVVEITPPPSQDLGEAS